MARRLKSSKELSASGSPRAKARAKAEKEAAARTERHALTRAPIAPARLNEREAEIWRGLASELVARRVLQAIDLSSLSRLVRLTAALEDMDPAARGYSALAASVLKLESAFGLTPASRAALEARGVGRPAPEKPEESAAAKYVGRKVIPFVAD